MPSLAQEEVSIDADIIATMLTRIYRGKYGNDGTKSLDRRLFEATHETFNRATASGIAEAVNRGVPTPSASFLELLDRNNAIFSAFRTHRMQKDVASLLLDDKGKIKKYADFKRDVAPIVGKYNGSWLRTEYATAVQRSRLATKWQQFVDEQDVFPNLEWMQSTALHPGEDHRIFWYTVRPVNDPFWSQHRPGDRWNCQCDLRQTDLPPTDIPTIPIGDAANSPAPGLDNNPGTDGQIFNDRHPYFPKNCTTCPFANMGKKLMALARGGRGDCYECVSADDNITRDRERRERYFQQLEEAAERVVQSIQEEIGINAELPIQHTSETTGVLKVTRKSLKNCIETSQHSRTVASKEAFLYAVKHPDILTYEHSEDVGEGKDMNNPTDRRNVERKQRRGVTQYNYYTFDYGDKKWVVGLEQIRNAYEQAYFIARWREEQ